MKIRSKSFHGIVKIGKRSCSIFLNRCMTFTFLCKEKRSENYGIAVWFYSGTGMHSSRMRTIRSSGRLSYNVHPPPCMPPAMYAPPPMHAPCYACPCHACCPCMPLTMHAPTMHAPHPAMHAPPTRHAPAVQVYPPLCMPAPPTMHAPVMHAPLRTECLTDGCENITFPQLLLRTVITYV